MFIICASALILPHASWAAVPTCDEVGGVPVNPGDPACYTEDSSGYYKTCTWYGAGSGSYWACDGGVQGTSSSVGTNCFPYLEALYSTCGGYGGCSNRTDFGAGDTYSEWVNTTSYKCYYLTVNEWGTCDVDTGMQSAISVTQHSTSGTSCQNLDEATTRSCAACGVASNSPTGEAPTEDLCIPLNTASTPILNTATNMWEWTCTADNGSVDCDVPNEEDGVCSSKYTDQVQDWPVGALPPTDLCDSGTAANFSDNGDNGWTWDCLKIGDNPLHSNKNCAAPCFDYRLNIDKEQFYWSDQDDVEIMVNIEKLGRCRDQYSCSITIDDDTQNGDTHTYTIDARQGVSAYDISGLCTADGRDDEVREDTVSGNCIARSCSPQGTCQSTPQAASSHSACQSTCSTNADCSKGRMIETRP